MRINSGFFLSDYTTDQPFKKTARGVIILLNQVLFYWVPLQKAHIMLIDCIIAKSGTSTALIKINVGYHSYFATYGFQVEVCSDCVPNNAYAQTIRSDSAPGSL